MNLKEAFRYQNFLNKMSTFARNRVVKLNICMNEQRTHKRQDANPDATDLVETVEKEFAYTTDQLLLFLESLINEKAGLSQAINDAKYIASINLDVALEENKFKQGIADSIKNLLNIKACKRKERGVAYKINEEGNQTAYYYDIENELTEAYDKNNAKLMMKRLISEADKTSAEIDTMMVTTTVYWEPLYDVNDSFEDVIASFVEGL